MADDRITLAEVEWALAWNVRGNAEQAAFASEAARLLGVALPLEPNTTTRRRGATVLWLGPESWLTVLQRDADGDDFYAMRRAFNAAGGALFDLSSTYVGWRISGPDATRMLNRNCPLDFHPRTFTAGACAQSMLGHVNALYYRPGESAEFIIIVARSFAIDAWENLCAAATTDGYRVGPRSGF